MKSTAFKILPPGLILPILLSAPSCDKKIGLVPAGDGLSAGEAQKQFERAVSLRPDSAKAHRNPADGWLKPGKPDSAEAGAKAAIKYGTQNQGYFHLTYSEVLIGERRNHQSACAELETARELGKDDPGVVSQVHQLQGEHCHGD